MFTTMSLDVSNLKTEREVQNLSLRQLSDMTGIDPKNLCKIEQGATDPRISTLTKICDALGLKITSDKK